MNWVYNLFYYLIFFLFFIYSELASTRTDLFSTFKIGALLSPKGKKPSTVFNNTFLEIEHQCNQYNMVQTLRVFLPYIEKRWLRWNTWESTGTLIPLDMGAKQVCSGGQCRYITIVKEFIGKYILIT